MGKMPSSLRSDKSVVGMSSDRIKTGWSRSYAICDRVLERKAWMGVVVAVRSQRLPDGRRAFQAKGLD